MNHRVSYVIAGAGTGDTSYWAVCSCGEDFESASPTAVCVWGPAHVTAALDEEGV